MALSGHALLTRNPAHNQLQPHNKRDIHGVARTACSNCTECPQVGGSILDWDEFVLIEKGKLMKFLRLQFISIPGHVLCAYCGCPPARHGKGLLDKQRRKGINGNGQNWKLDNHLLPLGMTSPQGERKRGRPRDSSQVAIIVNLC